MAVSYLSQTFKSSPYVPPIDLGLFAKVLGTKQQQSDLNFAKEQQRIDQLGSLDVMRDVDRNYLNEKINSLVSTVNNFGGSDFSDPNVFNQIEGTGSDIYSDNKVINSLYSTKQARKLLSGYDTYKSNPKFSKNYSAANEYIDMRAVNAWYSDPEVGKTYNGPSAPTPYVPYKETMLKALDKVKADYIDNVSIDGYYISKDGTSRLTPERVTAIAMQTLTPDEQAQIKRDGIFQARNIGPQHLIQKSVDQYQNQLEEAKSMKLYYEAQADAAVNDPTARRNYNLLADQKAAELKALYKSPEQLAKAAVAKYQQDPDEFAGQVYQNEFIGGMANLFSQNKTTRSVQGNTVAMFKERQRTLEDHFDRDYAQKDKHFYDGLAEKYFSDGMKMVVDPQTGKISGIKIAPVEGLTGTNVDVQDPNNIKVTPEAIKKAGDANKLEQDRVWTSFLSKFLTAHPELGIESPSANPEGTGTQLTLVGQQFLEGVNQQPGLQYEDLAGIENPVIQGQLKNAGLNSSQVQLLIDMHRNFEAVMDGKGSTVGKLDLNFVDASNRISILKEGERANQAVLDRAYDVVLNSSNLTPQEKQLYREYKLDPKKFTESNYITLSTGQTTEAKSRDSRIEAIESKIGMSKNEIENKVQSYLNPLSTHSIFRTKTFSETERKGGELSTFVANEINRGVGTFYLNGKATEAKPLESVAVESITPVDAGVMGDGSGRFYITSQVTIKGKDGSTTSTYVVPIDDKNAQVLGLYRDPYENINRSVNMMGRTGDIPVYVNNDLAVPITIVRPDKTDVNSGTYAQARFYDRDSKGNKILDPKRPGEFKSTLIQIPNTDGSKASESYVKALEIINKAGRNPVKPYDIEGFRQLLIENQLQ